MAKASRSGALKKAVPRNRGQIIPKGDGKWLVRFFNGRDATGKRQYPSELIEGTFKQAEKALTKMLGAADTQTFIAPTKLTLQAHCEAWLKTKVSLGPKTHREYGNRLEKDVYPTLGAKTLSALTGPMIQQWCASLIARGLSPRTVEFSHMVLRQALSYAVRHNLLLRNPCEFTELPRKEHTEQQVFTPAEATLFLEHTKGFSKWHPLWALMLTAGLRPQEALALQWTDIDLLGGSVTVRRALVEVTSGVYAPGEPKTKKSKRTVSVPGYTIEALQAQRTGIGATWVFPTSTGNHYDLTTVRKAWHRDILRANAIGGDTLPDITLYGARHTHITHLLMLGVHPKVAGDRAGHSSINVTMNTYSHVLPQVDKEAGDKIGTLLFPNAAGGNTMRTGT